MGTLHGYLGADPSQPLTLYQQQSLHLVGLVVVEYLFKMTTLCLLVLRAAVKLAQVAEQAQLPVQLVDLLKSPCMRSAPSTRRTSALAQHRPSHL